MAISLQKGQKVSLKKNTHTGLGEILVNLNWKRASGKKGFFSGLFGRASESEGIDLDLGCLFELKDGRKGTVQAVGRHFGAMNHPPFISLDGDDRTGASAAGENLRINGNEIAKIKRILVYTFIYEGIVNWQDANAKVTIQYPSAENIIIKMDDYNTESKMCALALFENVNDETLSVEKIVQFYSGHRAMDQAFRWGLNWVPGRK